MTKKYLLNTDAWTLEAPEAPLLVTGLLVVRPAMRVRNGPKPAVIRCAALTCLILQHRILLVIVLLMRCDRRG